MPLEKLVCSNCGGSRFAEKDGHLVCLFCQTEYLQVPDPLNPDDMTIREKEPAEETDKEKDANDAPYAHEFEIIQKAVAFQEPEQAIKFCNRILDDDPFNVHAWILKGRSLLIAHDGTLSARQSIEAVDCFEKAIKYSDASTVIGTKAECALAIMDGIKVLFDRMLEQTQGQYEYPGTLKMMAGNLACCKDELFKEISACGMDGQEFEGKMADQLAAAVRAVYVFEHDIYKALDKPDHDQWYQYDWTCSECLKLLKSCIALSRSREEKIVDYKYAIQILENMRRGVYWKSKDSTDPTVPRTRKQNKELAEQAMEFHNKLHLLDPKHEVPLSPFSGCYVATAVYGGYDLPNVWCLRRYRDEVLARNPAGRLFIKCYYRISPSLVRQFGDRDWFAAMLRPFLDAFCDRLEKRGIKKSAYQDAFRQSLK